MRTRDLLGILLVVAVLVAMSSVNSIRLYFPGGSGSLSMGSCLGFIAGALVVIAALCVLLGVNPRGIPKTTTHWVFGSIMVVIALGVVSGWLYSWRYASQNPGEQTYIDWFNDIVGVFAFGLVFGGTLYLPYINRSQAGETRCRNCNHLLRGLREPRCPECGETI